MSQVARAFGNAYRAQYGLPPLEVERRAGVEHLVVGQHHAQWIDDEQTLAELSYVDASGHAFVVVMIDGATMEPIEVDGRAVALVAKLGGLHDLLLPENWKLSDEMQRALAGLKASASP